MDIAGLGRQINSLKSDLSTDEIRLRMLEEERSKNLIKIDEAKALTTTLERVAILLQKTAERQRSYVCNQIESIGTTALQYVYGTGYSLEVELKQDKKRAECEVWVVDSTSGDGVVRLKPQNSKGGGIVDIVSLALRFAVLQVFNSPEIDGAVILDEPGKHISKEYSSLLSNFLTTISEQLDRQQIVITHNDFMAESAGTIIRVRREDGMSIVERG